MISSNFKWTASQCSVMDVLYSQYTYLIFHSFRFFWLFWLFLQKRKITYEWRQRRAHINMDMVILLFIDFFILWIFKNGKSLDIYLNKEINSIFKIIRSLAAKKRTYTIIMFSHRNTINRMLFEDENYRIWSAGEFALQLPPENGRD